jgi:hypothetical protein
VSTVFLQSLKCPLSRERPMLTTRSEVLRIVEGPTHQPLFKRALPIALYENWSMVLNLHVLASMFTSRTFTDPNSLFIQTV